MIMNLGSGDKEKSATGEAQTMTKDRPQVAPVAPGSPPVKQGAAPPPNDPNAKVTQQVKVLPTESNLAEGGKPKAKYKREKQRGAKR
jgi:hypothetical protein